jgi:uncharacterized Zn finger protein
MSCTCPDSAGVCKHIAATFYGVAARLDRQPELLFKLRNVDHLELIGQATSAANLDQALDSSAAATLSDSDLGSIFGIDLESAESVVPPPVKSAAKRPVRTKSAAVVSTAAAPAATSSRKRGKKDVSVAQASAKRSPRSAAKSTTKSAVPQTIGKSSSKSLKTNASKRRKPQQPAPAVVSAARKRPRKKKAASLQVVQAQGRHEQVR